MAALALLATFGVAQGCRRAEAPALAPVQSLADLLPVARWSGETDLVDFGEPQAQRHLGPGWHEEVERRGGRSWQWSRGLASDVHFWLATPRDRRAELTCIAHSRFPAGLTAEVSVNGTPVGTLAAATGLRTAAFALPAAALREGRNELRLTYQSTASAGLRARRGIACDTLRLVPPGEAGRAAPAASPAPAAAAGGTVRLPLGGGVAFAVEAPVGGRLALALEPDGAAAGHLEIEVTGEDGPTETHRLEPGAECCEPLPLGADAAPRLVQLTLRAVADDPARPDGALLVREPRLVAPAAAVAAARAAPSPAPEVAAGPGAPADHRPNLIVYLIDTLRADRLGAYGHPGGLTPHLDAFAREATLFENAIAQAPWTRPSVASLFTGLEPLDHGVWNLETKLGDGAVTLAERLSEVGYTTVGLSTNHHVSPVFGLAQGFGDFRFFAHDPDSRRVNRAAFAWLAEARAHAPFFLYVHTVDPHEPYEPTPELRARFAASVPAGFVGDQATLQRTDAASGEERRTLLRDLALLYDAEVAYNDRSFGDFVAELRRLDLYDSSWVVVLADHGEEFGEHGARGHSQNLHATSLDVPLMVKPPGPPAGRRVATPVQHVDVTTTLLRAAGVPVPSQLRGGDLLEIAARPPAAPRPIYSHIASRAFGMSVTRGGWKLIQELGTPPRPARLYRRETVADRAETTDHAAERPLRTELLRSLLGLEMARPRRSLASEAQVDEATRQGLRALGYL